MAICSSCKRVFDLSSAKESIDRRFGEGAYDNTYFDGTVCCESCAYDEIGAAMATGEELKELMGSSWYDD